MRMLFKSFFPSLYRSFAIQFRVDNIDTLVWWRNECLVFIGKIFSRLIIKVLSKSSEFIRKLFASFRSAIARRTCGCSARSFKMNHSISQFINRISLAFDYYFQWAEIKRDFSIFYFIFISLAVLPLLLLLFVSMFAYNSVHQHFLHIY